MIRLKICLCSIESQIWISRRVWGWLESTKSLLTGQGGYLWWMGAILEDVVGRDGWIYQGCLLNVSTFCILKNAWHLGEKWHISEQISLDGCISMKVHNFMHIFPPSNFPSFNLYFGTLFPSMFTLWNCLEHQEIIKSANRTAKCIISDV